MNAESMNLIQAMADSEDRSPAHISSEPIRVLLADDHTILRAGLRMMLSVQPDIEIVGEASDGRQAITEAQRLQPDGFARIASARSALSPAMAPPPGRSKPSTSACSPRKARSTRRARPCSRSLPIAIAWSAWRATCFSSFRPATSKSPIASRLPLAEAAKAHEALEARETVGFDDSLAVTAPRLRNFCDIRSECESACGSFR